MNIIEHPWQWAGTPQKAKPPERIILHHAAGTGSPEAVHGAHLAKGWLGIGYHFYVTLVGVIHRGRPEGTEGAHTLGWNDRSVGVCFEGNFETQTMPAPQLSAGRELLEYLKKLYPNAAPARHSDFDATACPGRLFPFEELAGGLYVYRCDPARMLLYVNGQGRTAAQVRDMTGADVVINGGLYELATGKPVCPLKAGGRVLSDDGYSYWGYGWNMGEPGLDLSTDMGAFDEYLACVCLLRQGRAETIRVGPGMGGSSRRTGMGRQKGRLALVCTTAAMTPQQLQSWALKEGFDDFVMLDGGGSTQGETTEWSVKSSRAVHNYICVWAGTGTIYRVQVGAFRSRQNAEALAQRLQKDGYGTPLVIKVNQ